ncbi:energy transducer TonB [Stenotrophomonas sp. 24(2023)]|uniref:energy transducer TonB n=1 Tax=Stenotrophomonas sp. 24(2023) TaxID=3068324 RepID=UPI0027E164CC|nr:energy transducer TonB [Stenotrophomonas sp. 24(2023)]WMJ67635.1 energy transducer TonB [Stenotrophomonas sp. 24(2023)]
MLLCLATPVYAQAPGRADPAPISTEVFFRPGDVPSTGAFVAPVVQHSPPPRFPPDSVPADTPVEMLLSMDIGLEGEVTNVDILRSTRNRDLDRAALAALQQWRFTPALSEGMAVRSRMGVKVVFGMREPVVPIP